MKPMTGSIWLLISLLLGETARSLDMRALAKMSLSRASVSAIEGYYAIGMQFSRVRKMERSLEGNT